MDTPEPTVQPARRTRLTVQEIEAVTVIGFVDRKILDEQNIQMTGEEIYRLVDELGRRKVVLDFGNVEFFSSAALGKVIGLMRKLQALKGKLILSRLDVAILEVFQITRLDRMVTIIPAWENAVKWFTSGCVDTLAACPIRGCTGKLRFPGGMVVDNRGTCPECRATARFLSPLAPPTCRIEYVQCATYEGEWVRGDVAFSDGVQKRSNGWTLSVVGRLDLFAGEELERVWMSVSEPRRIVLDISAATEVSHGGAEIVSRLAKGTERLGIVIPPEPTGLNVSRLPADIRRFTTPADANQATHADPTAAPTVTVSLAE